MVVVGSVYEKNKIIKDPDQEIYARHFDRSLIRKLSLSRFAQAAHQACCEPVKITAKFQWFWILYIIISFFSYTRTAIQITTGVYVVRYWLIIFVFVNGRSKKLISTDLSRCLEKLKNSSLLISQIIRLQIPKLTANTVPHTHS